MADDNDKSPLTRRRVLGGMATIGAAGALGAGTTALYNDEEGTGDLSLRAGEVDLTVDYTLTYPYNTDKNADGTLDGNKAFTCDLTDIKPGDEITFEFCPNIKGNPSYVDVSGEITADAENDRNEAEGDAPDPDGDGGELDTQLDATLYYKGSEDEPLKEGNFGEVMNALNDGIDLGTYGSEYVSSCIVLVLTLPKGADNRSQSDSVSFNLMFNAEQTRHNEDGIGNGNGNGNGS